MKRYLDEGGEIREPEASLVRQDWVDRRSVLSSVERGVDLLEGRGLIDPARVGLSGLSDGSATVQFALVNSHRFAVVATTQCCMEPVGMASLMSGQNIRHFQEEGFPRLTAPDPSFWKPLRGSCRAR